MWDDYYSWQPTIQLQNHIILSGFYGTPSAQTARFINALSGIACIDFERILEHKLSARLSRWAENNPLSALESEESALLTQTCQNSPPSLILLPAHTLFHPTIQQTILQKNLQGIIITRSRAAIWNSLQKLWESTPDRFLNIQKGTDLDEIHQYYLRWLSQCPKSWIRQPMQTETALEIAKRIITQLSET